jgi:hypothetical protein
MDLAFARALRMGTEAVHSADPTALAAIEGVQIPGWGGYDYSLLVDAVDVMELDDPPLAHSLNPHLIMLNTSFGGEPRQIHAIWRNLLAGSRGMILWDGEDATAHDDGTVGTRGEAYAATFAEIRGGICGCRPPASRSSTPRHPLLAGELRTQWMLERSRWRRVMTRTAETELEANAARDAMWAYERAITHLGLQPVYVKSAGDLRSRGFRALILPHAIALAPVDARAIREFAAAGGTVIADVQPGVFDAHSRRLPQPLLDAGMLRLIAPGELTGASLGVTPRTSEVPTGDVTSHTWRHGRTCSSACSATSPRMRQTRRLS